MLGHPPGTLDPPANMDAAEPSLLRAVHYQRAVARARSPSRPRSPQSWADELRWGPGVSGGLVVLGSREVAGAYPARSAAAGPGKPPGALPQQEATSVGTGLQGAPKPAWDPQAASRAPPHPKRQPALALRPERCPPRPSKRRGTVELRAGKAAQATGPGAGGSRAAGDRAARPPPRPPQAWSRRGGAGTQPMQGGRGATRPRRRLHSRLTREHPGPPPASAPDTPPPSCLPPAPALSRRAAADPPLATPTCPPVGPDGTPRPAPPQPSIGPFGPGRAAEQG